MNEDTSTVAIQSLELLEAPGITTEQFALEDFADGINLIHGPNAAGKTITARAIQAMLWPEAADPSYRLVGSFRLDGSRWRVNVSNASGRFQRDGRETEAPPLPPAQHRDSYHLPLHELLAAETTNERFAEVIARQSAGGFDLQEARAELGYDDRPSSRRIGEYQQASEAVERHREAQQAARELQQEEARLPALREELTAARDARERQELLDRTIDYLDKRRELRECEHRLESCPDELAGMTGEESSELENVVADIEHWQSRHDDAIDERDEAETAIEDAALPDGGPAVGELQSLKARRDDLRELQRDESRLVDELCGLEEKRQRIREAIPMSIGTEQLADLEPVNWQELSAFSRAAQRLEAQRQSMEALDSWARADGAGSTQQELERLMRGSTALENWLRSSDARSQRAALRTTLVIAIAACLSFVGGGLLLAWVNSLPWALFGVPGVLLLAYATYRWRGADHGVNRRATHEASYDELDLEPPTSWTESAVRERLSELYGRLAEARTNAEREEIREALIDEADIEGRETLVAERRAELEAAIGDAPDLTDVELTAVVKRLLDWQHAHDEVVAHRQKLEATRERLAASRDELAADLSDYGYETVDDAAAATANIRGLEERVEQRERAVRDRRTAEETIEEATRQLDELEETRTALYEACGLTVGDREGLRKRCDMVPTYEETKQARNEMKAVLEAARSELETYADFEASLLDTDRATLGTDRDEAKALAEQDDEIQRRITEVETRIEQAKQDSAVEEALENKERTLAALEQRRASDVSKLVGNVLVEHLQEASIEADRPMVFERARELLATITREQYRLDFDDRHGTFRAFDTKRQLGLSLDELSSGTRVQLLLAVRLAFVDVREQTVKPPLVLDETLANSDDARATAIIESLIELARNGRQVFYFTAQGHEVGKWRDVLADVDEESYRLIDIAAVRDFERGVTAPELDGAITTAVRPPEPGCHDLATYRNEIEVPPFNPFEPVGTAHLWYLVDDLDTLHTALSHGIERWGQLEQLIERGHVDALEIETTPLEQIRIRAAGLDAFASNWRIGRGEPINREVLEASGAVSETFIDRVTALCDRVHGDPSAVVGELRNGSVDRFRSDKTDELEAYLEAEGYIDTAQPLSPDVLRLRTMEAMIEHGLTAPAANKAVDELCDRINVE